LRGRVVDPASGVVAGHLADVLSDVPLAVVPMLCGLRTPREAKGAEVVRMRVLSAVALCLVLFSCGDDAGTKSAAPAVTGEFVGKASAEDAYVAVFTGNAKDNGRFDVVAYVCNRQVPLGGSTQLAEWFTGSGANNAVDLKSEAGTSRLKATLEAGRVTGTIELPGGKTVTFEAASSADGPAGIFVVNLDDQGNLVGTSRGGKTMKLAPIGGSDPGYRGTITSPSGSSVPYELYVRGGALTKQDLANMKAPRTIILPDGTSRGILDPIAKKGSNRSTLSGT